MLSKEEISQKKTTLFSISEKGFYQNVTLVWGVPIFFTILGGCTPGFGLRFSPFTLTFLNIFCFLIFTAIYFLYQKSMNTRLENSSFTAGEIKLYNFAVFNTFLRIIMPFQLLFIFSFTSVIVQLPIMEIIVLFSSQAAYLIIPITLRWYYSKNKPTTTIYYDGEELKLVFFDIFMFNYFYYYRYRLPRFDAFALSMIYYDDAEEILEIFLDHPNILRFHSSFTNRVYGTINDSVKQVLLRFILLPAFIFFMAIPVIVGIEELDFELWFLLNYGLMLLLLNVFYVIIGCYLEKRMKSEYRSFIGQDTDQIEVFYNLHRILQIGKLTKLGKLYKRYTWWVGSLSMADSFDEFERGSLST